LVHECCVLLLHCTALHCTALHCTARHRLSACHALRDCGSECEPLRWHSIEKADASQTESTYMAALCYMISAVAWSPVTLDMTDINTTQHSYRPNGCSGCIGASLLPGQEQRLADGGPLDAGALGEEPRREHGGLRHVPGRSSCCRAWCMVHGALCMVHGAWCMVHGAWCMVHGAWCMV
jgi:hypothetical protein